MRINKKSEKGYALIIVLVFVSLFLIMTLTVISVVNTEIRMCKRYINSTKAFFLAESGIERAMASIRDNTLVPSTFTLAETGLADNAELDTISITITSDYNGARGVYEVTSGATVGSLTRRIRADVAHHPPSKVFDYAYFINNWGWFYGAGITANGDVRSNGRFDFRYGPTVEGEVYAGQGIGGGETVNGKAGTLEDGEYIYQHPDSNILDMPNLQDLGYYETLARNSNSSVTVDGVALVNSVFGDDAGESGNMVLIGNPGHPIVIDGPVVVTGDLVIKGTVTGQGTIYAGRNIYLAGDITYQNPPDTPRPASDDPAVINQWVLSNEGRDIVGFAAAENVILGDYTGVNGGAWYANLWLFGMGSEDVGEDGIPDTDDTGEGDSIFQEEYEDLDEDGVFDDFYGWADVQTSDAITNFSNVPHSVNEFKDIASNNINTLDGIFYTNHAFSGRTGTNVSINGAIISKDEAIIYRNTITMNYDERINSRYRSDPNWLIDLQLPFSDRVELRGWWEQ